MRIEINKHKTLRSFDMIHPASCFIPDMGQVAAPDNRNVWIKLQAPHHKTAVNLATGELSLIEPKTQCECVEAKVVIE